ncbi:MAG TPA: methyl-accepting chemotaxis protein [Gaiellales bacterium]
MAADNDQHALERDPASTAPWALFGLLGLVVGAYTVSLFLRANGASFTWLDGWGVSSFELLASLLVLARAARSDRYRRFALMLGTGMCFWAVGDFAMTYETLGGRTPAAISLANILWAGFYPFAYVAVMMLIRQEARKLRVANYLDGVMAALAATAVFTAFLFDSTVRASGGGVAGTAINLVYPAGDMFLFVLVVVGLILLPLDRRTRWYLMGAACLVNTTGDVCALFPGLVAARLGFVANADAWPVSLLMLSAAAWMRPRIPRHELTELRPSFVLPSLAAGSALMVVLVASVHAVNRAGLLFAAAALATAGIRFGLTLKQLRGLTEERHRQLEQAAKIEQESREQLQSALAELEAAAQAEQASRVALQTAMQSYAEFSARAAEGASEQSAALAHTSTTVDEMRVAASTTARRAAEVAERARGSMQVSDEGARAVATIGDAMEEIRARVDEIARDILALSDRTQQIGEITETVNRLADRSNLLALNASIEAARAGEHGRGFAVVADEVRSLSEQSKAATAQVEKALADIQEATAAAVSASAAGTRVVETGLELTGRAGAVISSLTDTIHEASESVAEIAASAEQERAGIDQIAVSVRNVNEAAERLNELYRGLQEA